MAIDSYPKFENEIIDEYFQYPNSSEARKKMVGERLKSIRREADLTQKEVCEIIDITPQTYSGYEKGKYEPSMETLVRLSLLYRVSTDYILCRNVFNDHDDVEDYIENIHENEQIKDLKTMIALINKELEYIKKRFDDKT